MIKKTFHARVKLYIHPCPSILSEGVMAFAVQGCFCKWWGTRAFAIKTPSAVVVYLVRAHDVSGLGPGAAGSGKL